MMEVLLVAAQRDMIANAVSAVEGAGLKMAGSRCHRIRPRSVATGRLQRLAR